MSKEVSSDSISVTLSNQVIDAGVFSNLKYCNSFHYYFSVADSGMNRETG